MKYYSFTTWNHHTYHSFLPSFQTATTKNRIERINVEAISRTIATHETVTNANQSTNDRARPTENRLEELYASRKTPYLFHCRQLRLFRNLLLFSQNTSFHVMRQTHCSHYSSSPSSTYKLTVTVFSWIMSKKECQTFFI